MILPETTTERLLAVADIIECHPEQWDQEVWCDSEDGFELPVTKAAGQVDGLLSCGTHACVAGWAVTLHPNATLADWTSSEDASWLHAGRESLGLHPDLAKALFQYDVSASPADMADLLRHIAKVPEGERTFAAVEAILPDRLADIIYEEEDDD